MWVLSHCGILLKQLIVSVITKLFHMSRVMRFPTMWYVRAAKAQTSLRIRAVWSDPLLDAWIFYDCKATDTTSLGVSKLKGGCTCSSECTLVKIPHCWKSRVMAQLSWLLRKTHLKYRAKTAENEQNELREGPMGGSPKLPLYTMLFYTLLKRGRQINTWIYCLRSLAINKYLTQVYTILNFIKSN